MIALDTNLLVYAHRPEMPFHDRARELLTGLVRRPGYWAVPWPCVHEFLAVVTHPRIYREPTPIELAVNAVRVLEQSGALEFIGEGEGYLDSFAALAISAKLQGGVVHDARIAAICLFHGVAELWTADRDFSRFPKLKVRNPLLD